MRKRKSRLKSSYLQKKLVYNNHYGKPDELMKDGIYYSCSGNDAWSDYITKLINS